MKSGYDQFFKNAQKAAEKKPKTEVRSSMASGSQNSQVAENLRQKVKSKKAAKVRSFPWRLAGISILGLVLAAWGLVNIERIDKFFTKIEISILGGPAFAEEKIAESATKTDKTATDKKAEEARQPQAVQKKDFTQEEINHFSKLNERKHELDMREEELNKMEAELQAQKVEMEKRLKDLESVRGQISSVLEQKVQTDEKKVNQLVDVYSSMKPQSAAKVFETMDEDLAVEVLARMKKKNAAEIMNLIKAEKAQTFSEKIAGYKK